MARTLDAHLIQAEVEHERFGDVRSVGVGSIPTNPNNQRAGLEELNVIPDFIGEEQVTDIELQPAREVKVSHGMGLGGAGGVGVVAMWWGRGRLLSSGGGSKRRMCGWSRDTANTCWVPAISELVLLR
jgi:hypothetical protein